MKRGVCVKCGAETVFAKDNGIFFGKHGVVVRTGMLLLARTRLRPLVCTTCGYFELYIADPQKLSDVAKKWQHIPPTTS